MHLFACVHGYKIFCFAFSRALFLVVVEVSRFGLELHFGYFQNSLCFFLVCPMCVDRRFFTAFFLCLLSTPPLTGVGTRHYYRKLGYELEGPYMVKTLVYERDEADDYEY